MSALLPPSLLSWLHGVTFSFALNLVLISLSTVFWFNSFEGINSFYLWSEFHFLCVWVSTGAGMKGCSPSGERAGERAGQQGTKLRIGDKDAFWVDSEQSHRVKSVPWGAINNRGREENLDQRSLVLLIILNNIRLDLLDSTVIILWKDYSVLTWSLDLSMRLHLNIWQHRIIEL